MTCKKSDYEQLLAEYSNPLSAIALLKQYRPYLEAVPSLRRAEESLIIIPFPIVRLRQPASNLCEKTTEARMLPCEVAILMCDPEWKIKTGIEIFILSL